MLVRRYRATPFGVRVDFETSRGERLYSSYIPGSLEEPPVVRTDTSWHLIVIMAMMFLVVQTLPGLMQWLGVIAAAV
jgi:hypothetical protein